MRHLELIGQVPVAHALPALTQHASLFDEATWRQDHPLSPHTATRSIYLRMPRRVTVRSVFHALSVIDYPAMGIPQFAKLYADMSAVIKQGVPSRVARVMLVELKPYSKIKPHVDEGLYSERTERYHLPLRTNPGCVVEIGDESTHMEVGDVWWFDKHAQHCVINWGSEPRVHLIMDLFLP